MTASTGRHKNMGTWEIRSALWTALALCLIVFSSHHANATDGHCAPGIGEDIGSAAPSAEGVSSERLIALLQQLDEGKYDVRGLVVMRDCQIVMERYKTGIGRSHNHAMYSVTKSISSTLVGALLYQEKLKNLDTPITGLIERPSGLRGDGWNKLENITLKNVMQMSSGFDYKHDPSSNPIYDARQDRIGAVVSQNIIATPGTRFNYSDADAVMTGTVIAGISGDNLLDFAGKTLFKPLHMTNYAWWFPDQGGRLPGGWGLRLRPMDMLKLGQLYLQNGEWNGVRIFSATYPDLASAPGVSSRYGLHWWIGRVLGVQFFFASGFKGQRIYVFPSLKIVAALVASLPNKEDALVTTDVVTALIEATNPATSPISEEADDKLLKIQKTGFEGETHVRQDMQDSPRRF
ncbi:serine hydrolase domain-containing protein [Collimonas fungivorans]|uniref:Beta-lactamase n=1 Tax=Collimonas fungivorans (strain Ter331) TaxID=1005048 RepID=G0ACC8_COLFT|nr:serine hydrolase [Collimonas fungivorans]AEK62483.1 Beta-lactamase [Collimonas fungivorans Ter331]